MRRLYKYRFWLWVCLETLFYLLGARLALAVFSFQQLTWFFERPARQPELSGDARTFMCRGVRYIIYYLDQRMLGNRTTCFHRAIAAQAVLRRHRVGTTLYYGIAKVQDPFGAPEPGLSRHVWVQDGENGVVDHLILREVNYKIMARYPELRTN